MANVQCPASKKHALGGGGQVTGTGASVISSVPINASNVPVANGKPASGWQVKSSATAQIKIYVICGP